jgi:late competence protein required for DNA uptake (superfamily II DNA/RNA helicase)
MRCSVCGYLGLELVIDYRSDNVYCYDCADMNGVTNDTQIAELKRLIRERDDDSS